MYFDEYPNIVFGLIGLFDTIMLVFILAMVCLGKFGDEKDSGQSPAEASQMGDKMTDLDGFNDS